MALPCPPLARRLARRSTAPLLWPRRHRIQNRTSPSPIRSCRGCRGSTRSSRRQGTLAKNWKVVREHDCVECRLVAVELFLVPRALLAVEVVVAGLLCLHVENGDAVLVLNDKVRNSDGIPFYAVSGNAARKESLGSIRVDWGRIGSGRVGWGQGRRRLPALEYLRAEGREACA